MRINTILTAGTARQPRAVVRVNGSPLPGWISWEVTSNTYYEADSFRVSFALSALPPMSAPTWGRIDSTSQPKQSPADWLSQQTEIYVEIFAGFPSDPDHPTLGDNMQSLIYGRVDDIELDPVGRVVNVRGRDLTAAFIDQRTPGKNWIAKTSSDIAAELAAGHGMTAVVTPTTTTVGTYYQHDQVKLHANQSEWEVLSWLAREEGFVLYVKGNELHFEPDSAATSDPYVLAWQSDPFAANVQQISFSRALTVAKGVTVVVRSASLKTKVPVVETFPGPAKVIQAGKASPFGLTQTYHFSLPAGADSARCQRYAQARYHEIISHEMRMQARLPADNLLSAKSVIRVQGTGTAFDQIYYPMSVTRTMSADEGYTMTVHAKNQNPATAALAS
jgi:Phage tail baseplate hub (GPD)